MEHLTEDYILEQIENICNDYQALVKDDDVKRGFAREFTESLDDYLFNNNCEIFSFTELYRKVKRELGL